MNPVADLAFLGGAKAIPSAAVAPEPPAQRPPRWGFIHRSILIAVAATGFAGYLAAQSEEIVVPELPSPQRPGHYEIRLYPIEVAHGRALADARRDIAAGNLVRIEYGLQSDPAHRFARRLEEKWKIRIESKGCVGSPEEQAYAHVYNALMEDEILRRYGVRYEALAETIEKAIEEEAPVPTPAKGPVFNDRQPPGMPP